MTELLDSELQAVWDKRRKAPQIDTFEEFKKKRGWLSHLASRYETEADIATKRAGLVRNAPAVAAGLATLPTYGL